MTLGVAAVALALGTVGAGAAQAAVRPAALGNCGSYAAPNDRLCLMNSDATSPYLGFTILHVYTDPNTGHDAAWAEASGMAGAWVYLDTSYDGGKSITHGWELKAQNTSGVWATWTTPGAVADGPGVSVHACATANDGKYYCTAWN